MFTKIQQPDMLHQIIGQIKANIAAGKLKKGDRLPSERQLVEMFGLSRATIREALKALEMLGLIDCTHGSGNYISRSLSHSLEEPLGIMFMLEGGSPAQVHQLRRGLEFAAAGQAALMAETWEKAEMRQLCSRIEASGCEAEKVRLDRELHTTIAKAAKNPLIITLLNACESLISAHIHDAREKIMGGEQGESPINLQHRQVVDAIDAGDRAAAEAAILAHMALIARNMDLD